MGQLKNSSDKSVFMRHGDVKANISIDIKFLRDMNNKLGMLTDKEHEDALFAINEDTLGQICKFHNISRKDVLNKLQSGISPNKSAPPIKKGTMRANTMEAPIDIDLLTQTP
jgi:hypothetical protein